MTKSQKHLIDTTLTLFISVFLSLEITFCLCFFSFQLFVVMQFERTGGFFSTIFYSAA